MPVPSKLLTSGMGADQFSDMCPPPLAMMYTTADTTRIDSVATCRTNIARATFAESEMPHAKSTAKMNSSAMVVGNSGIALHNDWEYNTALVADTKALEA